MKNIFYPFIWLWNSIINFLHNFNRSLSWAKFMWRNYEWDFHYLYKVIEKKLGEMEKTIRKGYQMNSQSYGRQIKIARWYLNQLIEDDYNKNLKELFDKKFGEIIINKTPSEQSDYFYIDFHFANCKTDDEKKYANKVMSRIYKIDEYCRIKTRKKLFHIMDRWIDGWWE